MNKIVSTDFITDDVQRLVPVDATATTPKNAAVAKLMKAWEAKTTQRTAKGAGLTLMAVSLAACNDDNTTTDTDTDTDTDTTVVGQTFTLTTGTDAVEKRGVVAKMMKAWEAKATKRAANATGFTLMAVSLAACNDDVDTTPISQADYDAATAAAATAATAQAAAEATASTAVAAAATAATAQAAAEAAAATAATAQAAAEAAAATAAAAQVAAETQAAADVAAAATAQAAAEAAAATAATAQAAAEAATIVAEAARDAALAAQTTAETAQAAAETSLAALVSELEAAGFTDLTDLIAAYQALIAPSVGIFTTGTDSLVGGAGSDAFTAAAGTIIAADSVTDTSTTDNDTLTIVSTGSVGAFRSTNIETIDVTINSLAADTVDASNFTGVNTLSVTRGDVTIGGAILTGNKVVTVNAVNASNIDAINVGTGTSNVVIGQAAVAGGTGVTLNANAASGNVTVTGAATINATGAGAGDTVTVNVSSVAAEDAKAVNVTTGAATVTIGAFTGAIDVNAASATSVSLAGATGGATVVAASAPTADSTVTVVDVDASGATITVGTGVDDATTAANIGVDVSIEGTAALTDVATISGAGHIELDIDGAAGQNVDIITLSGNGAGVVYDLAAPAAGTAASFTKAGTQSVEIMGDASEFSGVTVTNIDVIDVIAGAAAVFNASLFTGVGNVDLGVDNAGNAITVNNNQTWEITADQTTGLDYDFSATTMGDLTVIAGDDNGVDPAVGTITVGAFNAAAGAAATTGTVTIEASIANFTATSTVLGAAQTLVVTGDEDVTLGAVTALAVNAANSSGIINMTAGANVATVATGSGNDAVVINDATNGGAVVAHTVTTGAGNDNITVTETAATATIDAGAGNDTFTLTGLTAYVVAGGEGNDTFSTGADIEAVILGGNGTDTFTVTTGGITYSNNTQFALNSIEAINLTATNGTTTLSAAQLAGNSTFAITADSATDVLSVATTAAGSVDGSGITISAGSTATISYVGGTGANSMTGGAAGESFQGGAGADTIEGGDGNDTFVLEGLTTETGSANASVGMVVNLGATAITGATIISDVGDFLGGGATSVAAGTATHVYAANVAGKAGLPDVRLHDLRHTFASLLINNGRSIYEVQKLLGHTQIKTTQRYAHLTQETLLDASNIGTAAVAASLGMVQQPTVIEGEIYDAAELAPDRQAGYRRPAAISAGSQRPKAAIGQVVQAGSPMHPAG